MSKFKKFLCWLLLNFLLALLMLILVGAMQADAFSDNFENGLGNWDILVPGWSIGGETFGLSAIQDLAGSRMIYNDTTGFNYWEFYVVDTAQSTSRFINFSFKADNTGNNYIGIGLSNGVFSAGSLGTGAGFTFAPFSYVGGMYWHKVTISKVGNNFEINFYNATNGTLIGNRVASSVDTGFDGILLYSTGAFAIGRFDNIVALGSTPVGSVSFNASSYKNYNTAMITYVLNSPDFGTYDYKIDTMNVNTFEIKNTWTLSSSSGNVTQSLANYGSANYYAILSRKLKSETWSSSHYVDYDIATVTAVAYLQGTTYNVEVGTNLSNVIINTTQSSIWHNTTSNTIGTYNLYDYDEDMSIQMNTSKVNFTHVNYSWTPLSSVLYTQNLYLFPNNLTRSSGGVQGVVMDDRLYQAISGASVTIANASWNASVTSNSIGYYNFSNLVNGTYNITASKTGLAEQVNYSINVTDQTVWIIQNILLSLKYTLTIKAQDASTTVYLTSFTSCVEGSCTSTTTGNTTQKLYYGAYYISASSSGYYDNGMTILLTTDNTETIQLIKTPTSYPSYQGSPHNVRFTVQDIYGNKKSGVNVTAQGISSTLGNWSWLKGLLGINYESYALHAMPMSGLTGSDGSITFLMVESIYYKIDSVKISDGINQTDYIYPKGSDYTITIDTPQTSTFSYNLSHSTNDITLTWTTNKTINSLNFTIFNNTNLVHQLITNNTTGQSIYTVTNLNSKYYVYMIANTSEGIYTKKEIINYQTGVLREDCGLGKGCIIQWGSGDTKFELPQWSYNSMSIFLVWIVAGSFGALFASLGAILALALMLLFMFWGWLQGTGISLTIIGTIMVLAIVNYLGNKG